MKRVVVVCSGNICRSPMAAPLVERHLQRVQVPGMVLSAGTLGIHGSKAAPLAIEVMGEWGIDLSSHRSQGLSPALIRLADYLLVMEPEHAAYVLERDRLAEARVHGLFDYAEPRLPRIEDPVGLERDAFERTRDLLDQTIGRWADHVRALL